MPGVEGKTDGALARLGGCGVRSARNGHGARDRPAILGLALALAHAPSLKKKKRKERKGDKMLVVMMEIERKGVGRLGI